VSGKEDIMSALHRIQQFARFIPIAAVLAAVPATAVAATPSTSSSTASTGCATVYWGSLAKTSSAHTTDQITNVRAGQHACYDRLVIDLNGVGSGAVGYDVRYVDHVYAQGSGKVVPLAGGAQIEVVVHAPTYNPNTGSATYRPANPQKLVNVAGYSTFRQVAYGGSFEGETTIGLGVRARLPMKAFVLDGPGAGQRLVIDVQHHW
jgi:hypothetical protein